MGSFLNKINRSGYSLEQKTGLFITSLFVGSFLLLTAMIYVAPNFEVAYHGTNYSLLSLHPFDLSQSNPLRYRILAPLIGYLTFLKGDLFFILPLIFGLLLLSAIYKHYRSIQFSVVESINMAAIIAFSCTIFIPLRAPGYTDTITYFFLFLAFTSVKKPRLTALYFGLAMLNHECSIFLLPGLIAYQNYANEKKVISLNKTSLLFFVACLPYLAYRYYISTHSSVEYDMSFYFSKETILGNLKTISSIFLPGLFFAFKLFWIYPVLAIVILIKNRSYQLIIVLMLIIIPVIVQLVIAYDVTRMLCSMFPAILLSAEALRNRIGAIKFEKISTVLMLINFLIFQYFASSYSMVPLPPVFLN